MVTGDRDLYPYLWRNGASGDFTIDVKVDAVNPGGYSRAGLMVRAGLRPEDPRVALMMGRDWVELRSRAVLAASEQGPSASMPYAPRWLRIVRAGSTFTGYTSDDATTWTLLGSTTAALPDPLYVGVALRPGGNLERPHAVFDDFRYEGAPLDPGARFAAAHGGWLLAASDRGLHVLDAVTGPVPALAGTFPAMAGSIAASGGDLFAAERGTLSRLALARGPSIPTVQLSLPPSAPPGTRLALAATVQDDGGLPLDAYTAELRVNGAVVAVTDSRLPAAFELPVAGASASIELRVRDMAGNVASAQAVVALAAAAAEDVQFRVPSSVMEGTAFTVVAIPSRPARVAAVRFSFDGGDGSVVATASAPTFAAELVAPSVAFDTTIALRAVPVDALGNAIGPPVTSSDIVVRDDALGPPVVGLSVASPSGRIYEGTPVTLDATAVAAAEIREVRFAVDGVVGESVVAPAWRGTVWMPLFAEASATGHPVTLSAVVVDVDGRTGAADIAVTVFDDREAPTATLTLEPSGAVVAGARLTATVHAADTVALGRVTTEARVGATVVATGGSTLVYDVPLSTTPGTVIDVSSSILDQAGNAAVPAPSASVVVLAPALPGPAVVATSLAGASRVAISGDHLYAATPRGVEIAALTRGPAPSLTPLARLGSDPAVDVAVARGLAVVARGAAGIDVVDVSDPATPHLLGHLGGTFDRVGTGGSLFYAADSSNYLVKELDLRNPSAPVLQPTLSSGFSGSISGKLIGSERLGVFVANGRTVYWTFVSNGTSPITDSGYFDLGAGAEGRAADADGDLIVAATVRDLQIIAPFPATSYGRYRMATLPLPAPARDVVVANGRAYVACEDGVLRIADVRDARTARIIASEPLDARALAVSGGVLVAATPAGIELRSLAGAGVSAVAAVGSATPADLPRAIAPFHGSVLAAAATAGLVHVDLARPSAPAISAVAAGDVRQVETLGRNIYELNGGTVSRITEGISLTQARFSGPTALTALGSAVSRFALAPDRIWTVGGGAVRTAALPAATAPVGLDLGTSAVDVAGDESRAVVALDQAGFALVALDAAGQLASRPTPFVGAVKAVALDGSLALVAGTRLAIFDLAADRPAQLSSVPLAASAQRVRLFGRLAVVSEGSAGVELWDFTDPTKPFRAAAVPATSARDAVVTGELLAVVDGDHVAIFAMPPVNAAPSVRLRLPLGTPAVQPGSFVTVSAVASGVGLDDAELLVDGEPWGHLDDAEAGTTWRVPNSAQPGNLVSLQVRVRSAGGSAISAAQTVRIAPTSAAAPQIRIVLPGTNSTYRSGQTVEAYACLDSGGLPPFAVRARYVTSAGEQYDLGAMGVHPGSPTCYLQTLRMPIVAAQTSGSFVVDLVDAAARRATAAVTMTLLPDAAAPSVPTGLPSVLKAGPTVNVVTLTATDDGYVWVKLLLDGVEIARTGEASGTVTLDRFQLLLPEDSVGKTVTLTATATDGAGRATSTSQTYTVLPDGVAPVPVFTTAPPATATEGQVVRIAGQATDVDNDLRLVEILADGIPIVSLGQVYVSVDYTMPLATERTSVLFAIRATDSRGRVATIAASAATQIVTSATPQAAFKTVPAQGAEGAEIWVYAEATDASNDLRLLVIYADGAEIARATRPYDSSGAIGLYGYYRMPLVAEKASVTFTAVATDAVGRTSVPASATVPVVASPPPAITFVYQSPLVIGYPEQICAQAIDDGLVQSMTFAIDGLASARAPVSCGTRCLQICEEILVEAAPLLEATATDNAGHMSSASRAPCTAGATTNCTAVAPNAPPVPTLSIPDYCVAGRTSYVNGWVTDERSTLAWREYRVEGQVIGQRFESPSTSGINASYVTTIAGTKTFEHVAQDLGGLSGSVSATRTVYPAGTSDTCDKPLPIPANKAWNVSYVFTAQPVPICNIGNATHGAWLTLPFDGPVESVTLYTSYYVAAQDGCAAGATQVCGYSTSTYGPLADPRFFMWGGGYVQITSARLGRGALCDRAWTNITCPAGDSCDPDAQGVYRCREAAAPTLPLGAICSPGTTPACASGTTCALDTGGVYQCRTSVCSNGLDEDADGLTDYPADPSCESAAGATEAACVPGTPPGPSLDGMPPPFMVSWAPPLGPSLLLDAGCGHVATGAEWVFNWQAPTAGNFRIEVVSDGPVPDDIVLYVRRANCLGTELACDRGRPAGRSSAVTVSLAASDLVSIVVDSAGTAMNPITLSVTPVP